MGATSTLATQSPASTSIPPSSSCVRHRTCEKSRRRSIRSRSTRVCASATMSITITRPPGRTMRAISATAALGSAMWCSASRDTTMSKALSPNGSAPATSLDKGHVGMVLCLGKPPTLGQHCWGGIQAGHRGRVLRERPSAGARPRRHLKNALIPAKLQDLNKMSQVVSAREVS